MLQCGRPAVAGWVFAIGGYDSTPAQMRIMATNDAMVRSSNMSRIMARLSCIDLAGILSNAPAGVEMGTTHP